MVEYKQDKGLVLSSGWWHGFVVGCASCFIAIVIVVVVLALIGVI